MTFALNDIHNIYNRDQISKQDHDSHQQLSYTMYDLFHKHLSTASRPTTYICPCMPAYRYQLILLISSKSTCFVSFHESTQHMAYLQAVTKSFTPYHMWKHNSHRMIFHIIIKNCMIFPQGPSIYQPCIITRENPTSDKH